MKIWTLAWDTDGGTGASVHLTEREAFMALIEGQLDEDDHAEAIEQLDHDGEEGYDFWEWFDENGRGSLDTFSIERHEIELPAATATPTESSTGPIQVFNDRELATVLHALRVLQTYRDSKPLCDSHNACDHFDEVEPMNDIEIDALCERLNLAPEHPKRSIPQLSGAVGDFVRTAAAGNTDADDLQRLACDLLGLEHPQKSHITRYSGAVCALLGLEHPIRVGEDAFIREEALKEITVTPIKVTRLDEGVKH